MKEDADERARKNQLLRDRLENMKKEVGDTVNGLMAKMMDMNPEDLMTAEEIDAHLTDAFNKFDEDRSGQLGAWEFQQAWFYLGLKGSETEIKEAFGNVDNNNSGMIDIDEFKNAIKGERMMELNLKHVLTKMGHMADANLKLPTSNLVLT